MFQRAQDYLEAPAYRQIPHRLRVGARARVRKDRNAFDAIVDDEIAHLRDHPSEDGLNVLASLVAEGDLTDGEILDQVNTVIGAGYDTTAASLAWMLWRAMLERGLWERLRDEADAVLGLPDNRDDPDHTTLKRLELADRVMHETLDPSAWSSTALRGRAHASHRPNRLRPSSGVERLVTPESPLRVPPSGDLLVVTGRLERTIPELARWHTWRRREG